jgi:hypothetical protein
MPDITVQVALRLADNMSGRAAKSLKAVERATAEIGRAAHEAGTAQTNAGRAAEQANSRATKGAEATARAQKKIADAAKAVARASREVERADPGGKLARGFDSARQKAEALGRAVKGLGNVGKGAFQVGAGVAAAGTAAYMAVRKPIDYERRLAMMANTAFADRTTLEGRQAGMQELRGAVDTAVRSGGGSRENAADALDAMIASGSVKIDAAKSMLPVIQKFATSTGAQSTEIADILIRGIQNNFFTADEAETALNKALAAGQQGGFELKDMARWLPQMMAAAQGMQSMEGFERLLASAQAAVTTAGSKDQAGNNVVNLLAKLGSKELSERVKKDYNIDLAGSLAARRAKGQTPLDAFVDIVDTEIVGKNKEFQALKKQAGTAKGEDQKKIFEDMAQILQASAVGEIITDRQALMALIAEMSQRDYIKSVGAAMKNADGAVDLNYKLVSGTTSAAIERTANEKDIAMQSVLDKASPAIIAMTDAMTSAAREFPALTTGVAGAATLFASFAAGSAVSQGAKLLFSKGAATAEAATSGAAAAAAAAKSATAATAATAGTAGTAAATAGTAATVGAAGPVAAAAALAAAGIISGYKLGKLWDERGLQGSWLDAEQQQWNARADGSEEFNFLPPADRRELDAMSLSPSDLLSRRAQQQGTAAAQAEQPGPSVVIPAPQVNNDIKVYMDSREVAARVEERIDRESRRY